MKNIILLTSLIAYFAFSLFSYSQESKFKVSKDGITDFIVTDCESKTQTDIYKKTNEWIALTFKNRKEVIQSQIEYNMIRIEGFSESFNGISNANYLIEISFKEGRYKFDPIKFTIINGLNEFDFFSTYEDYFKKDGSVKKRLKVTVNGVENTINDLNTSLKNYILDKVKKEDW